MGKSKSTHWDEFRSAFEASSKKPRATKHLKLSSAMRVQLLEKVLAVANAVRARHKPPERLVRSNPAYVYHDGDGSVYCYDVYHHYMPWPASWPETIADVPTFCRERGIGYAK